MSGLVIRGEQVEVAGLKIINFLDEPALSLDMPNDGNRRPMGAEVKAIILHTTVGKNHDPVVVRAAAPPAAHLARRVIKGWQRTDRRAGAHLVVDADGTVFCIADLADDMTYSASGANASTVAVEVCQQQRGDLFVAQLDALALLVEAIVEKFGLPRRVCFPYLRVRPGILEERGVYGHRDVSDNRGSGDPSDAVMRVFASRELWESF